QQQAPDLDVLVLGCTHYPLLRPLLTRVARALFGHEVTLVDSAEAMADVAHAELSRLGLLRDGDDAPGALRCYVTDDARIDEVGHRFLGRHLGDIMRVDL